MFHDVRDLSQTKFPGRYNLKSFLDKTPIPISSWASLIKNIR